MPDATSPQTNPTVMWYVYIVECRDGTYYTGITTDIERRIKEHNHSPAGARYTRSRRPVRLHYSEDANNRSDALKRELQIKKLSSKHKRSLAKSPLDTRESL